MNDLLDASRIEYLIWGGFACGGLLLSVHGLLGQSARQTGGRTAKVFVELQRKSFHMIGGCIICSVYHYGIKFGVMAPAFDPNHLNSPTEAKLADRPLDAGIVFIAACLAVWMLEASRILIPAVQRWYLGSFKGLIREKEMRKAAGVAYFLPGALAAMLAAPSNIAILGILFLSIGDAASSLGTAAGVVSIGSSSRKVEGSIGCFVVCMLLGMYAGLPAGVARTAAGLVTFGELLAEVIGLDDNFVLPMLTVVGVRLGLFPQFVQLVTLMGLCLAVGVSLGLAVGATTPKEKQDRVAD